jgi:hypothetical protein
VLTFTSLATTSSCDSGGTAFVWDVEGWEQLHTFTGYKGPVWALYCEGGQKLLNGSADGIIKVWRSATLSEQVDDMSVIDGSAGAGVGAGGKKSARGKRASKRSMVKLEADAESVIAAAEGEEGGERMSQVEGGVEMEELEEEGEGGAEVEGVVEAEIGGGTVDEEVRKKNAQLGGTAEVEMGDDEGDDGVTAAAEPKPFIMGPASWGLDGEEVTDW